MRFSFTKIFLLFAAAMISAGCSRKAEDNRQCHLRFGSSGVVKSLDPSLGSDLVSRNMCGVIYDTLLQYDYPNIPYKLEPSMLKKMPELSADGKTYTFELRDDLYFHESAIFKSRSDRKVTSDDVIFSFKRIIDTSRNSPLYWIFRNKIKGIEDFRKATAEDCGGNYPALEGLQKIDDLRFKIILERPDYRFLYFLALPNCGIISHKAVLADKDHFSTKPIGSGAFKLKTWKKGYKIEFERFNDYREEYFEQAVNPADRTKKLPLADGMTFYIFKRNFAPWLLFLQKELDMAVLDKDNLDILDNSNGELPEDLKKKNIKLFRTPSFELRYVGFNFRDPIFAGNHKLRMALSCAYNLPRRLQHYKGQLLPAPGPIPPGVAGCNPNWQNPYSYDLERAKKLLAEAGYPEGIDPATGKQLTLTFDLNGSTSTHRQLGELMASDMAKIGVKIVPILNSSPRFFAKMASGQIQMFYLSWAGDYPDAENFLQLFYGPNAGSCNRTCYKDSTFDAMFNRIISMQDSPERTKLYSEMSAYITGKTPWIFDGIPVNYQLTHEYLENFVPYNFNFNYHKYLNKNHNGK